MVPDRRIKYPVTEEVTGYAVLPGVYYEGDKDKENAMGGTCRNVRDKGGAYRVLMWGWEGGGGGEETTWKT